MADDEITMKVKVTNGFDIIGVAVEDIEEGDDVVIVNGFVWKRESYQRSQNPFLPRSFVERLEKEQPTNQTNQPKKRGYEFL